MSDRYFIGMSKSHVRIITAMCFVFLSVGTQGDTDDEDILSNETDIFRFNVQNVNFFTTPGALSEESTSRRRGPDAETFYRFAVGETIQLFVSQENQINFTKVHFVNVWGAEDKEVQIIIAKLDSMNTFLDQKMNISKDKLALSEISPNERSVMPVDWVTIDIMGRGWREVERFIDEKCTQRNLTKAEEDELYPLREWLKLSDQELAIAYDSIKGHMEKSLMGAESHRPYTLPASSTPIHPFSIP